MDSKTIEDVDSKAEFRKPSNDSANRKYRRRSSVSGSSSSSDGSQHERSSSPLPSKKDTTKISEDKRRRDDGRGLDRDYDRSHFSRHSDQNSSRSYHRNDDHRRRDKHVEDYDRGHSRSSYRSVRDSHDNHSLHSSRGERDYHGSRDYTNDMDTYSRKKSDGSGNRSRDKESSDRVGTGRKYTNNEDRNRDKDRDRRVDGRDYDFGKTDRRRSSGDHKSDRSSITEDPKGQQNDSSSRRDSTGHHWKEVTQRDIKGLDSETTNEEKRGHDNWDSYKEKKYGKPEGQTTSDTKASSINDQDSVAKKPKLFSHDISGSGADGTSEQSFVTDSDIDAAKIAAMKAAELVNKNLVGTGYMSADQKKKLLWGNKKNTKIEESAHRWDVANFGDRERQEKFNKLMGVKGDAKVGNHADDPDVEKQQEQLQLDLERQYTLGLRRRDGRTVGLGL